MRDFGVLSLKCDVLIKHFPSKLWDLYRRGGRRIVRARGSNDSKRVRRIMVLEHALSLQSVGWPMMNKELPSPHPPEAVKPGSHLPCLGPPYFPGSPDARLPWKLYFPWKHSSSVETSGEHL